MNKKIIFLIAAIVIILLLLYYFLIYKPSQNALQLMEGAPCTIGGKIPGTVKQGVCVPNIKEETISI